MSQLFRSIRKRQKTWLAVLGVMCIIAFTVGSVATLDFRSGGASQDPVVVTTKYGDISESEIQQMLQARTILNQFMLRLVQETATAIKQEKVRPDLTDQQLYQFLERQLQSLGMLRPASETSVIEQLIVQRKAADLGVVVSDTTINEFLRRVTMNMITADQLRTLLSSMNLTQGRLFDGLRGQLMAAYMEKLMADPIGSAPPAQRWELFRRLRQTATAEVLPIKVEDFVGQVPEPSTAELQAFFEEYKDKPAIPGSPDPGFYQEVKAQFQYAKADLEALMKVAESTVTEAEVVEYYEKNKQRFPYTDADPPAEEEEKKDDAAPAEGQPAADTPAGEGAAEENKPSEVAPSSETPASESSENPAAPSAPAAGAAPAAAPAPEPQTSLRAAPSNAAREELRGHAGDDLLLAQVDEPVFGTGADVATPSAPLTFDEQMDRLTNEWQLPTDLRSGPRPEFEPLWKMEKRIRQQLAFERVFKDNEGHFAELREKMTTFYDEHYEEFQKFNEALRDGKELPTPPKFDMETAVKAYPGLTAHESPLLSAVEMQVETDIGKSAVDGVERQPFGIVAYQSLRPFFVRQSQDFFGSRYLFWKIAETKEFIPTFEQMKDEVVRAWKLREARKLALARAEELANRARSEKKSLKEVFAGDAGLEVTDTGPFSWLTYGSVPVGLTPNQPPRLSQVPGVDTPGPDFMRAVFHLEPSEIGMAMNHPETVVYVVQLETSSPSETVLRETFMVENFGRYAIAAQFDRQELSQAWSKQFIEDAGLDWERMAH
jgi:hypothetical protein